MLAPKTVANCYVASFKRDGRNIVAAKVDASRCAAVCVDVARCIYTCLRIGPGTLPECFLMCERNWQSASVAGCWGPRRFPNLAAPAASGRSAIRIPLGSPDFSEKVLSKWRGFASERATRAARITRPFCTRRIVPPEINAGSGRGAPNLRAVFLVCASSGSRRD